MARGKITVAVDIEGLGTGEKHARIHIITNNPNPTTRAQLLGVILSPPPPGIVAILAVMPEGNVDPVTLKGDPADVGIRVARDGFFLLQLDPLVSPIISILATLGQSVPADILMM